MRKSTSGFTIVELLIVIVVISILATITVVAYNGIQERARRASLGSDLANAAKRMEVARARSGAEGYPTSLPTDVSASSGNVIQLTTDDVGSFCINGYSGSSIVGSYSSSDGQRDYLCGGAPLGSPVGGSLPAVPRGQNLVSGFSTWALTGGITYDSSQDRLVFDGSTSGTATSPLVRIDGATGARLLVDAYATQPSPTNTPSSSVYFGSRYYGADGVTPATSSAGWTGNGNAQVLSLSTWRSFTWSTPTGAPVMYVQFIINSAPTSRTSDNIYRNPQIQAYN